MKMGLDSTIDYLSSLERQHEERVGSIRNLLKGKLRFTKIPPETRLQRVAQYRAKNEQEEAFGAPTRIERLGAPPAEHAAAGRANVRGQSRFYCCSDASGALQEGRVVTGQYDPAPGDTVIITEWRTTCPMLLFPIGYSALVFEVAGSSRRLAADELAYLAQLSGDARRFRDWLDVTFTDPSAAHKDPRYLIQQAIADAAFSVPGVHGIKYPTTRHPNLGTDNVVLDTAFAERALALVGARIVEVLELTEDGANTRKRASLAGLRNGDLTWDHHLNDRISIRLGKDLPEPGELNAWKTWQPDP